MTSAPTAAAPTRRDELIDTAARLFGERGYRGTTIRDIAGAMGMLSGSLYAHIDSKEDLLFEIVRDTGERTVAAFSPIAASELAPRDKLRALLRAHCELAREMAGRSRVFLFERRELTGARAAEAERYYAWVDEVWSQVIADGVDDGSFRDVDQRFARLLVVSVTLWLYQWYDPDGPLEPIDIADRFFDLMHAGLRTPDGP